ncbi:UspA domain protein [Gloeothece citriformis PCC 7424]|uniref:UspA domain protein n=1 Tax=Gloeothece citriformis (strain PCC 7424) TaxID=65393 RepID=B7KGV9_GLOC7|nr:universal stress protein [Gloeothece citriformis]ACK73446.1 UspA domain protein [Gloeothece citriformis PCC 7424]
MKAETITNQTETPQPSESDYQKILVAVDYLDSTPKIFRQALNIAKINNAQLMIFHSIQGEMTGIPEMVAYAGMGAYSGIYSQEMVEYEQQLMKEATEELHTWLESWVTEATKQEVKAESNYSVGDPGQKICELANNWGADLIIVGRRGRKGLSEFFLGSVSNYVIHHAPCSVLVVQH